MPERRTPSVPRPSSPEARARMQRQRRRDTNPEMALRRALHARGLRYRVDSQVLPGLRRRHDVVFVGARVVVEVRGCYWHACPKHATQPKANAAWWTEKLKANARRDADTESALRAAGWHVVVVWEHEPIHDAADRVEMAVRRRR